MSKIEVNTIEPQCGTTVTVGKCTSTVAVPGNVIKSNAVQASDGGNIVSQSGTDITLGASGDTINLASGASQSGFGRTGTVDWDTSSIKTAEFTAVSGNGYFVNTTAGAVTVNLPAGSAGDIIGLKDYAGTWDSYAVTLNANGSEKIGGGSDSDPTLTNEGGSVLLVYVDGTQGWLTTQQSVTTSPTGTENFIVATGGTPCSGAIVCTNYKTHTFTGPGTFCVSQIATCAANNLVSYMVVAGGGGSGSSSYTGGGGAGGFREVVSPSAPYTGSPLDGYPSAPNRITVSASPYTIEVGGGGAGGTAPVDNNRGSDGNNSVFSTITAGYGGGGGAYIPTPVCSNRTGRSGASGGGGAANAGPAGAGNTPSTTPAQGFNGGAGSGTSGGGGGGATAVGATGGPSCVGTAGGAGATTQIPGSPITKSAGGRGGGSANPACVAPANSGGGGGHDAGAGGSGIVVIRYKFQ